MNEAQKPNVRFVPQSRRCRSQPQVISPRIRNYRIPAKPKLFISIEREFAPMRYRRHTDAIQTCHFRLANPIRGLCDFTLPTRRKMTACNLCASDRSARIRFPAGCESSPRRANRIPINFPRRMGKLRYPPAIHSKISILWLIFCFKWRVILLCWKDSPYSRPAGLLLHGQ